MRMTLLGIVKHLDKIKYLSLRFVPARVNLLPDDPLFKCGKKAFSNSVVVAVSTTAHVEPAMVCK